MRRAALALALALPLLTGLAQAQQAPQSPEAQQVVPQPAPGAAAPPTSTQAPPAEGLPLESPLQSGRAPDPSASGPSASDRAQQDWRALHSRTLSWAAGIAMAGTLLVLVLFFLIRGRVRIRAGFSGRAMPRFNFVERAAHWMTAICFILLALSGLNVTFGRQLIRPAIGPEAFATLSRWGETAHNLLAFPFTLGILLLFVLWVGSSLPAREDATWLSQGGGMISGRYPKAGRFNAGQKGMFWITVLGGAALAVSGYLLLFPVAGMDLAGLQWAQLTHGIVSAVMVAAILVHIYIRSLGVEGAFSAMWDGHVDYNWAREHHALWVEQELAQAHEAIRPGSSKPDSRPAGAD
ncbi:formate dehydrogenase subunit gamma [Pseudoroseomonas ludipueritiae]|uniref:Formate dehydrogenase subunit gamma n=1 Tax=Pseudoroseomonas ludipueritiae TaxID=198093 RepID=A0ABR7RC58_9PROT|nr:formate dehydrogenase subunit gamma [Pseudoroseomonas ludipueritiae]MBC9179338.1 formate dehydrogenase subunit gamma [Pseudoroseomonas ludipueritiae]MCG7362815.1 formate dehydrogenase subunit gamma [Roseomonas sp. ACRSG]